MMQFIFIGFGGFFGAISRFAVAKYTSGFAGSFPLGTLIVNVTGSFLLAFISYYALSGKQINPDLRNFITIGFIGAYTTMSTFSYETMRFFDQGKYDLFAFNFLLNSGLCLLAIALGRASALLFVR